MTKEEHQLKSTIGQAKMHLQQAEEALRRAMELNRKIRVHEEVSTAWSYAAQARLHIERIAKKGV